MSFDRATFYAYLRHSSLFDHGLTARQVQGTEAILNAWDKSGYTDERWLADVLGQTYHETGRAMYPVREGGKGKGHPYGIAAANGQVYYGRGYSQLTWLSNYEKADKALGLGGRLVANADLALDIDIAAQVILRGMAEGWFTKFKLSDYLNDHLADYLHCRRIINGMDKAEIIAGYALIFFAAIQAGEHKAADHTTPVAAARSSPEIPDSSKASPSPPQAGDVGAMLGKLDPSTIVGSIVSQRPDASATDILAEISKVIPTVVTDTVGSVIAPVSPSPGTSAPQDAAEQPDTGPDIMNALSILAGLFGGVSGKIGVASTIVGELPHLVSGTIANVSELPKVKTDIDKLIADIKAGKWSDAPNDLHALIGEFAVILSNYGVSLPALTTMVDKLPAAPAIVKAA